MDDLIISPEPFIQKCKTLAKSKNCFLDVVDGRIRLAWTVSSGNGRVEFMERADVIGLGITYDMLLDALFDAGGAVDVDGCYPVNDAIKNRLRTLMLFHH
jgi:hypothetical protein